MFLWLFIFPDEGNRAAAETEIAPWVWQADARWAGRDVQAASWGFIGEKVPGPAGALSSSIGYDVQGTMFTGHA